MVSKPLLNRIGLLVPMILSAVALAIVLANVIARVPPSPDEGTSAHLFQLLIVAQTPFIALFVATADWSRLMRPLRALAVQGLAIATAIGAVGLAGY